MRLNSYVPMLVAMIVAAGVGAWFTPDETGSQGTGPTPRIMAAASSSPVTWSATDVRVSDPALLFPGDIKDLFEPSIAIDPLDTDHLIAVGIDFSTQNYDPGIWSGHRIYRSLDGGMTWADEGMTGPLDWDAGDPVAFFGPDGMTYFSELAKLVHPTQRVGGIRVITADPGSTDWNDPVVAVSRAQLGELCPSPDKEWLSRGPDGTLYLVWTDFVYHCDPFIDDPFVSSQSYASASIEMITSRDDGATWSAPVTVYDAFAIGAVPVATADGTIHVAHWSGATLSGPGTCPGIRTSAASIFYEDPRALTNLVVSTSSDGGATWAHHEVPVCTFEAEFLTKAGTTGVGANPTIDVDPTTGRVHVIYPNFELVPHRSTLMSIHTDDGGFTWSSPVEVTAGTTDDAWLPTLEIDDAGRLHLAYVVTQASDDSGGVAYRSSTDGGASWSAPVMLTTAPWLLEDDPALGHYIEMDVVADRIVVAWTDARLGSPTEIWARTGTVGGA